VSQIHSSNISPPWLYAGASTVKNGAAKAKLISVANGSERRITTNVQTWTGPEIRTLCRSAQLVSAYQQWAAFASRKLPRLGLAYGADAEELLGDARLLLRLGKDFLILFQGQRSIAQIGRNLRGALLSEVESELAREFSEIYGTCIDKAQPAYVRYVSEFSDRYVYWESLVLPFAGDDNGMSTFVLAHSLPIDEKLDILKVIFDHSNVGMIAAMPPLGAGHDLSEARILLMNAQAREILKLPDLDEPIRFVRDLGAWFRDGAMWTQTGAADDGQRGRFRYHDRETGKSYLLTIEPLSRFVLFTIVPDIGLAPAAAA
jgi:hypothetical protein